VLKFINRYSLIVLVLLVTGCSSLGSAYQVESRKIIDYLLADMPLPPDAMIKKEPTVILGTGTGIAGRIVMMSSVSPAENLVFYGNSTQGSGWQLVSSTVAEEIVLVYTKEGRHATIEILRRTDYGNTLAGVAGFGRLFGSPNNSQITISVVHPGAIQEQNPYLALDKNRIELEGTLAGRDGN
jgi:NAD(P)-dependent dehydrogenase (short-subunit alcohol dehydrogenase family)